jgi:hypothetical protein
MEAPDIFPQANIFTSEEACWLKKGLEAERFSGLPGVNFYKSREPACSEARVALAYVILHHPSGLFRCGYDSRC